MAECYIVQQISNAVRNGMGQANSASDWWSWWTGGYNYTHYTVTIPNVSGISKVEFEGNYFFDKGDFAYTSLCSLSIKKNGETIAQGVNKKTLDVVAGDVLEVIIVIDALMTGTNGYRGRSGMSISYDSMRFTTTVTLPTISEMQYASEVNRLAGILGVSSVSSNSDITLSGVQAIGTAVGTMKDAWSGTGSATAVTFDSSEAKKANINSCVTNMTGKYAIRSTIAPDAQS